jgi:hypothetical protein
MAGPPIKGVGVRQAHEAINCLIRTPKEQRGVAFQIVADWIKANECLTAAAPAKAPIPAARGAA